MRDAAREFDVPVADPEDVNTPAVRELLAGYRPDLLVVCDYGRILAPEILATARFGGINLHASLLPKYRGAAPINWALYHGETETGVTVIHMTPRVDAGPCVAQAATPIEPDETAVELEIRLAQLGAGLVCNVVTGLEAGPLEAIPQDPALASKAPKLKKSDALIDWTRPATAIKNQIRALEPWPKTYTLWHRGGEEPLRLILGPVDVVELAEHHPPGTVVEATGNRLVIAAGRSAVAPRGIQPAGKRAMTVEEFLRGYRLRAGERLGEGDGGKGIGD
jgi:methionyl-tRNA formyltransferase